MRKLLLLTVAIILSGMGAFSQAVYYYDDFESYAVGDYIAVENPTWWTTWSNDPGSGEDGIISSDFGSQAVLIDEDPSASDLILKLGDKTSGGWRIDWKMFVETGYAGYFNFQHFEAPGIEWACEVYFLEDGTGELYAGSSTPITFTYPKDTWFNVVTWVNLDGDEASMHVNNVPVHTWPFSNEASAPGGTLQLGAVDFFAGAVSGETPKYYFDEVSVSEYLPTIYWDNFDDYTAGEYIAVVNPTWWTTWSGLPGSGEDGLITDAMAHSLPNSVVIDEDPSASDLLLKLGDRTSGNYELAWYMYVETGYAGYYNIQHFEAPGIEWAFEIYFLEDGTGELYNGSSTPVTFTYPLDTWFRVKHNINLDEDNIELIIYGTLVDSWPFSNEASSTGGTLQLGAVDFFAGAVSGETPKYYFDDVEFLPNPTVLYEDDIESYNVDEYMAVVNPTWWTTWSNDPGSGEDGLIVDTYANSPTKSFIIDEDPSAADLILKLGDKTSGAYELSWYMYVETGFAGYYNIQHFEAPGIEWASEVYFLEDGTGELYAGSSTPITFTYPKDTWFQVVQMINLDADFTMLNINSNLVHSWTFSNEASAPGGTNQLGGVDFFAGAVSGESPVAYFDDVSFIQLTGAGSPAIVVTPTELSATADEGTTTSQMLSIENAGTADLTYTIDVIYDFPTMNANVPVSVGTGSHSVHTLGYATREAELNQDASNYYPANKDVVALQYHDGNALHSITWGDGTEPISPIVAAMFPAQMTLPYAGMMLTSVDVNINAYGADFILKVYDMGNYYQPGELLVSQPFSPLLGWNNIVLETPVMITGADIWVGYQFTQLANEGVPTTDEGPVNPNGDFISTGVGWHHLSDNPALPWNWIITANLTGEPISQWLTVFPEEGTVVPGEMADITAYFDATGLMPGMYYAHLLIQSNDPEMGQVEVPVTFEVTEGAIVTSVILDFEDVEDWVLTFDEWTTFDNDLIDTYTTGDFDYPHEGEAFAYMAFNPDLTDPPQTDNADLQPHGGERFGAAIAVPPPPFNDDWLISPQVTLGMNSSITMWVKSYTDQYGLEKYNVAVSTTGTAPADFEVISGETPLLAPADAWEEVTLDLSAYDGQTVYVGIQCVSEDAWIFMVDDISIDFTVGVPETPVAEVGLYPNPASDFVRISAGAGMKEVHIFNYLGQNVYSQAVSGNNLTLSTTGLESGVYVIRIRTDQGDVVRKLTIR